jgi:DNA-binding response OmpR family regulator
MSEDKQLDRGRILIADDEDTFLNSTADLLRREGYACDTATNADAADELLRANKYDLLISDIKMPGNPNLELIHSIPQVAVGMPVILVTGYPSVDSAIRSLQLPVAAYLVKPIDFDELLNHVRSAVGRYRLYQVILRVQERLGHWQEDMQRTEAVVRQSQVGVSPVPVDMFMDLTLANIVASLTDLRNLIESLQHHEGSKEACHLLGCPRPAAFVKTMHEVIEVLKGTKNSFKSKELGELRQRLESLVQELE